MKNVLVSLVSIILLTQGCTSTHQSAVDRRKELVRNLCSTDVAKNQSMVQIAYVNAQGAVVQGDISATAISNTKSWPTALAMTEKPVVRVRTQGMCTAPYWVTPYNYYLVNVPCSSVSEESLADIYGIARASTMEDAESQALSNCEALSENFADSTSGVSSYNSALECKVFYRTVCNY